MVAAGGIQPVQSNVRVATRKGSSGGQPESLALAMSNGAELVMQDYGLDVYNADK